MATLIYHLTCIENLASIVGQGLLCDAEVQRRGLAPTRIGYAELKERRMRTPVRAGPAGSIGDYVPFFFGPRPPMLYAIWRGLVDGYEGRQSDVVHLVTTAEGIADAGHGFAFTNGHAVMEISDFFDDLSDLTAIDWPLMGERYWRDTPEDPDRKRRRQAEFLVHQGCPWERIIGIGAMTVEAVERTEAALTGAQHVPPVRRRSDWYY